MKKLITVIFLFILTLPTFSQIKKDELFKTWIAYKYHDSDGDHFSFPPETKNDYLKININGTYESLESGKTLIKGKWSFNEKDNILIISQKVSKKFPSKIISKVIRLTSEDFVIEGKDIGGDKLTMYFKRKK